MKQLSLAATFTLHVSISCKHDARLSGLDGHLQQLTMSTTLSETSKSSAESLVLHPQPARRSVPSVGEVLFGARTTPHCDILTNPIKLQSR